MDERQKGAIGREVAVGGRLGRTIARRRLSAPGVERLMANKTMATPQKEEAQEFSFRPATPAQVLLPTNVATDASHGFHADLLPFSR
jgi:hypothetical protein